MSDHVTATVRCPSCLGVLDRARNVGPTQKAPAAGDFTVCAKCGAIAVFLNPQGALRRADATDMNELGPETRAHLEQAQAIVRRGFRQ